jgi:NAD(P)-dependent dehydrogenase (short-subunit alcohol dehydrogenase family)
MGRLEGKVALVTGSAQGIGAASARRLAAEGAAVVCADINDDKNEATVRDITERGGSAVSVHTDVGDLDQFRTAVSCAVDTFGGIDVLHNNAFWSGGGYIVDMEPEDWDRSLHASLTSVFFGMKVAIPFMIERGGGSVVNMSSVDGLFGNPCGAAYSAAKAGIILITKTAALEYGRKGIRVNAIAPGGVDTPALDLMTSLQADFKERSAAAHATGKLIQPEEIANVVLFLASDESSAITGTTILADAGWTAGTDITVSLPPYGEPFA